MLIRTEGANIQAWCTPCLSMQNHVIMILKGNRISKVQCQKCNDEHVYRKQQPKKRKNSATQEMIDSNDYQQRLAVANIEEALPYTLSASFEKDNLLNHTKFGIGFVRKLIPGAKMEVLFESGAKILVYNR